MEEGRKGDCLAFRPRICYCFILIVPSNSKLQAALCIWGSVTVQKLFFSIWSIFSFIHSSTSFLFPESSLFFNLCKETLSFSSNLFVILLGSTGKSNYYCISHYIRILLCLSCWPHDQPFSGGNPKCLVSLCNSIFIQNLLLCHYGVLWKGHLIMN